MDALLRRPAWVLPIILLALLEAAPAAIADGRDVLADARDGRVDGCYSRAEFNDALSRIRDDQRLYGTLRDVIRDGEISNVSVPGQPCGSGRRVSGSAVPAGGGASPVVMGSLLGAVALVGTGAGWLARRSR